MLTDANAKIKLIKNSLSNIVFLDLSNLQQQQFDYHPILCPSFHDETLVSRGSNLAFFVEPHFSAALEWHSGQPNNEGKTLLLMQYLSRKCIVCLMGRTERFMESSKILNRIS